MLPDRVIRNNGVEPNLWRFLMDEEAAGVLPAGPIAVSLAAWTARRGELLSRAEPIGAWLKPDDDPLAIGADVGAFAIIGIQFPKLADGRGYSTAVLVRTRLKYTGELRAFGDVGRDQLFYLKRCGFDSFSLAGHHDPEAALAGMGTFSLRYQGSVDDPQPLFRKRLAAGAAQ